MGVLLTVALQGALIGTLVMGTERLPANLHSSRSGVWDGARPIVQVGNEKAVWAEGSGVTRAALKLVYRAE